MSDIAHVPHDIGQPATLGIVAADEPERVDDETLFSLLAAQARDRKASELWMTAVGGAMNAGLIWWQYPVLHWLAAGFTAVAAYGIWGLADRAIRRSELAAPMMRGPRAALAVVRAFTIPVGVVAGIAAAAGFMAMALRNFGRMG